MAIVVMAKFNKSSSRSSDICVTSADKNSTKSHNSGEFDWDESTQGVILGAFFYGYLVFQVLGGRLAELFGAKWLCTGGIAASLVINALTPLIARSGYYWLLLASRVVLVVKSEPKDHPWISEHELNYIHSNIAANNTSVDNKDRPKRSVPWLKILTSKEYMIDFTILIDRTHRIINLRLFMSGFLADFIISKNIMDKTLLRKLFETTATLGSGICLAAIPLSGCNDTLAMIALGMIAGGESAVVADLSGNFTATVFAIGNTIAFTCGFITPLVIGYILDASDQTRRQWSYIFYMSAAINILGGVVFAIFGSAKRQDWDMDEESVTDDSVNYLLKNIKATTINTRHTTANTLMPAIQPPRGGSAFSVSHLSPLQPPSHRQALPFLPFGTHLPRLH
ncbi:unnamed protein product [Medioppia subpectinata]|uniref:Uncharacterized protein n=1 Tax=Medioppia subpectinata TaxID=1979941 RepID=A0A7R9PUX3_9ACAR|nr:unnamed protein product [Medioppia subpectinata]CAG2102000.1 unnamed protein product [Medioppia subpectinata]